MGVLAHRLFTLDRWLVPQRHERKFSDARACRIISNISPNPAEVVSEVSESLDYF